MQIRVLTGKESRATSNVEHARIVSTVERGNSEGTRTEGGERPANGKKRLLETL